MTNIVLPEDIKKDEDPQEEELKYQATEEDEEIFFLMYHMHMAPSEAANMDKDYRKWVINRFMIQKHMEKEMMERHRLMSQIGGVGGLKG
jgi:hypothetical protein